MFSSRVCVGVLAVLLVVGCDTRRMTSRQLERVAKDWCLAVRASQVIPVYPLTEDVEVGDVYVVQTPTEDQVKVYNARGFLPLENLAARLPVGGYAKFYKNGYGMYGAEATPPRHWQFPSTQPALVPSDYGTAPRAAFPTYGFSVSRSEGFNVAVPVQAVPIGMSLLNSASADGLITFKDSYTYGRSMEELQALAQEFVDRNPRFVEQFEPANGRQFYLRVVNRVYLTKQVNVSLFANQATSARGTAGAPQPIELLNIGKSGTNASKIFDEVNKVINTSATQPAGTGSTPGAAAPAGAGGAGAGGAGGAGAATAAGTAAAGAGAVTGPPIGGTVKVTAASSRTISMVETFDRPLVLGYIAFDMPIHAGGLLGAPVSTQAQLDRRTVFRGKKVEFGEDANSACLEKWLNSPEGEKRLQDVREFVAQRERVPVGDVQLTEVIYGRPNRVLREQIVSAFAVPGCQTP
jgi:hypothetical protein